MVLMCVLECPPRLQQPLGVVTFDLQLCRDVVK
jgi:hypothetical protein